MSSSVACTPVARAVTLFGGSSSTSTSEVVLEPSCQQSKLAMILLPHSEVVSIDTICNFEALGVPPNEPHHLLSDEDGD